MSLNGMLAGFLVSLTIVGTSAYFAWRDRYLKRMLPLHLFLLVACWCAVFTAWWNQVPTPAPVRAAIPSPFVCTIRDTPSFHLRIGK